MLKLKQFFGGGKENIVCNKKIKKCYTKIVRYMFFLITNNLLPTKFWMYFCRCCHSEQICIGHGLYPDLNFCISFWPHLRSQPWCSEAVRVAMAAVAGAPCHPKHPQCSFPFHLECEIAAGAALTSALRGQLLKSDVHLSGWGTSTDGGKKRGGRKEAINK